MAEYIEREALLRDLGEKPLAWSDTESEMQERSDWQRFKSIIEAQPAADVAPVAHGEWRTSVLYGYVYTFVCSECGYVDVYPFDDRHRYCPNCGAKMDGGANDGVD